jgi:hypothetical protein
VSREPLHFTLTPRGCYKLAWHPRGWGTPAERRPRDQFTALWPATPAEKRPRNQFTAIWPATPVERGPRDQFNAIWPATPAERRPREIYTTQKASYTCGDAHKQILHHRQIQKTNTRYPDAQGAQGTLGRRDKGQGSDPNPSGRGQPRSLGGA